MRVIIIPIRVFLIRGFRKIFITGGLTSFLFILIFVGGLLILLVIVTRTSPQEETRGSLILVLGTFCFLLRTPFGVEERESLVENRMFLILKLDSLLFLLFLVVLRLIILSFFLLKYKGLIRVV